jgi:acetoacetyl-CoA reductase/3-oxoacyl-[acyl-carrier protein] reductase
MATTDSQTQPAIRDRDLTGRVALVTGGTRGIGAAICQALAADGAVVAAGYSSNQARADELRQSVEAEGGALTLHQGNIGDAEDCERVINEVIEQHGRLDILVNNAGITVDKLFLKMSPADWDKVVQVDLSGAFYMSKPALAHMIKRGTGRVINISSVSGEMGNVGQVNYTAAKAGMFGLTKTLAKEAALMLRVAGTLEKGMGVTVNCIAAGLTETDMVSTIPPYMLAEIVERIPAHRAGHPEEIARVAAFLAQDASGYITGQIWDVDGGLNM